MKCTAMTELASEIARIKSPAFIILEPIFFIFIQEKESKLMHFKLSIAILWI